MDGFRKQGRERIIILRQEKGLIQRIIPVGNCKSHNEMRTDSTNQETSGSFTCEIPIFAFGMHKKCYAAQKRA